MHPDPDDPRTWPPSALAFARRRLRATTGSPELVAILQARLREAGRITFAEFMGQALYHPEHGYYASPELKMGREGDFLTSPETHPAFGALVCRWLERLWVSLGRPGRFEVVEAGAGTGALAEQILGYAGSRYSHLARSLDYAIIEASATLRARQQERLAAHGARVRWLDGLGALSAASVSGCVLSNELLDALPVHRVEMTPSGLREVFVTLRGGEFTEELGDPSTPEISAFFARVGAAPPVRAQAEVGLAAEAWYRGAACVLRRGALLTVDYGCPADQLYTSARPRGTLLCYFRHTANEEPYRRVGTQDITAHVDFTALRRAGEREGLRTVEETIQAEWLRSLGIADWARGAELWPEGLPPTPGDLAALVDPEALGRLRVLVQAVG